MEREEIVRTEFLTVRKGWDPEAVRAHLEAVAERLPRQAESLGDVAAERVGEIVAAAEATAARIEQEAKERAEATLAEARAQAESLLGSAREDAQRRIEQAQAAVEGLVGQAEELRSRVGSLGQNLGGDAPEPEPVAPEPEPAAGIEPDPPAPEPEPAPASVAADPEPAPASEAPSESSTSTGDLIAKLKNGAAANPDPGASDDDDVVAARLVAMKLALDGADREAIASQLRTEFGARGDDRALLDDVLARAGRG